MYNLYEGILTKIEKPIIDNRVNQIVNKSSEKEPKLTGVEIKLKYSEMIEKKYLLGEISNNLEGKSITLKTFGNYENGIVTVIQHIDISGQENQVKKRSYRDNLDLLSILSQKEISSSVRKAE